MSQADLPHALETACSEIEFSLPRPVAGTWNFPIDSYEGIFDMIHAWKDEEESIIEQIEAATRAWILRQEDTVADSRVAHFVACRFQTVFRFITQLTPAFAFNGTYSEFLSYLLFDWWAEIGRDRYLCYVLPDELDAIKKVRNWKPGHN